MPQVFLSRADLALVEQGIRILQEQQSAGGEAEVERLPQHRRVDLGRPRRVLKPAWSDNDLEIRIPSVENSVLVDIPEAATWVDYAFKAIQVAAAAYEIYKAVKKGVEFDDRLQVNPEIGLAHQRYSIEELIAARNEMENALFAAGA